MFQDSVPAGSYNDPFLSSVCGCVYGPLGVFIIFPVLSTLGCDGYRSGVSAWLQVFHSFPDVCHG